jgi:UDP-GlcNAc:undecaprenyl-phosphate GlcNAc-1-phosphate transferase
LFADRLFKQNYIDGSNIGPLVAIIAVGVCLGFLPYNWHPSKIMMGDAGALFLGVLLAVPTITIGGRTDHAFSGNTFFFFGPLLIPVLILGVPILDTVFSFLRRTVHRQRWHQADAGHLHHRLMRLGHGPRRTVVILWAWTALLSGVALVPTYFPKGGSNTLVPFVVAALALLLLAWFHPGIRSRRERHERARHPTGHPGEDVVDLAERRRQRA